jgi:hypothetical protein
MIHRGSIRLVVVALIGVSACGGKSAQTGSTSVDGSSGQEVSDSSTGSQNGDDAETLAACPWPPSLDPVDASNGACIAARTYLLCKGSNGGAEGCLSNDPTRCPGPNLTVGVTYSACKDQCTAGEYAVACGGPGPGPWPDPLPGCRGISDGPGGGTLSCCPCGQGGAPEAEAGLSFNCGGTSTCDGHTQVCEHVQGGVPPGVDYFACIPIPSGCDGGASCACLIGALRGRGATACSGAAGELTVEIDVP